MGLSVGVDDEDVRRVVAVPRTVFLRGRIAYRIAVAG